MRSARLSSFAILSLGAATIFVAHGCSPDFFPGGPGNVNGNTSDPNANDNAGNGNANDNSNGNANDNGGIDNDNGSEPGEQAGEFTPGETLNVDGDGFSVSVPGDAANEPFTLTAQAVSSSGLPTAPTGFTLSGIDLGPDGARYDAPVSVTIDLSEPTIATELPALVYDTQLNRWVGTGANAVVVDGGTRARFNTDHFSLFGIPDPIDPPAPGDPPGAFIVISNNGIFESDVISSDSAAFTYSEVGDTFNISATQSEVGPTGMVVTKAIGLRGVFIATIDNYLVAAIGGGQSLYNDGQLNEPVVGVVILSVMGDDNVSASAYLATPERAITATLNSP